MARRRRPEKRIILPDPKYGDEVLSKFMNSVMLDGKKSVAELIVYGALETVETRAKREPIGVFHDALGDRLLALVHDGIHELGQHHVPVFGVRDDLALLGRVTTGHVFDSRKYGLKRLAQAALADRRRHPYEAVERPLRDRIKSGRRSYFGRLAPYLDRRCFRFFTPCVSSTPRRMW